jgi:hypothetical protein
MGGLGRAAVVGIRLCNCFTDRAEVYKFSLKFPPKKHNAQSGEAHQACISSCQQQPFHFKHHLFFRRRSAHHRTSMPKRYQ